MNMTTLEKYREKLEELRRKIGPEGLSHQEYMAFQELSYRISVLETFQAYCKSAPVTMDTRTMGFHYLMVESYVRCVLVERRFGLKTDEEGQKKRETAMVSFKRVALDGLRRFSSYKAQTPEQYRADINRYINTILPVWMQFRNTYVNI